jgi:hypothetical protein
MADPHPCYHSPINYYIICGDMKMFASKKTAPPKEGNKTVKDGTQTMNGTTVTKSGITLDVKKWSAKFKGWDTGIDTISMEIASTAGLGKTHTAMTAPNPALGDTENKGFRVARKFHNKNYLKLHTWEDILMFASHCIEAEDIDTVILDSSADLIPMAEAHYLQDPDGRGKYQGAKWYSNVNSRVNNLINSLRESGMNVIFTSRMKDLYENDVMTKKDALVRGWKEAFYKFDIQVVLQSGLVYKGKKYYTGKTVGKITKNAMTQEGHYLKYVLPVPDVGITFQMIVDVASEYVPNADEKLKEMLS